MEAGSEEEHAPTIKFSIDDVPDLKRSDAAQDFLAELMRVEFEAHEKDRKLLYTASLRILPGARFGSSIASAVTTRRTRRFLADGEDDLVLVIPQSTMTVRTPGVDDMVIQPGEGMVVSQAREMQIIHPETAQSWALRLQHRDVAQLLPRLGSAPVMAIPRGTPMLSMLRRYGRLLQDEPLADGSSQRLAVRHLQEMAAMAIGSSPDFLAQAESGTLAAVRLKMVEADIAAHLGDRALSLEWLAARLQITPRHLQRLFAENGTTYSDTLRRMRVARARAMLEAPRNAGRTISAIALDCGFPEASALNRAFRQEFGLTPSDVRWKN